MKYVLVQKKSFLFSESECKESLNMNLDIDNNDNMYSQSPNDGILKKTVAIFPSIQSIFISELLKLPWQIPLLANTKKYLSSRAGPIRVRIPPREYTDPYWAS